MTCHLVLKFVLAAMCRRTMTACTGQERVRGGAKNRRPRAESRASSYFLQVVCSWRDYMTKIFWVAFCSAVDIGLSQWSFEFITISLYTMTKASSIIFILIFAILFGLERLVCA